MKMTPVELDEGLPKTYTAASHQKHISNMKELTSQSCIESGQDVGEDGQCAIVSQVPEKWVDPKSEDLYLNYTRQITLESAVGAVGRRQAGLAPRAGHVLPPIPPQNFGEDVTKRLDMLRKELHKVKKKLKKSNDRYKKQENEIQKLKDGHKKILHILGVMKKMACASCTLFEIFQNINIPVMDDDTVEGTPDVEDDSGSDCSGDDVTKRLDMLEKELHKANKKLKKSNDHHKKRYKKHGEEIQKLEDGHKEIRHIFCVMKKMAGTSSTLIEIFQNINIPVMDDDTVGGTLDVEDDSGSESGGDESEDELDSRRFTCEYV